MRSALILIGMTMTLAACGSGNEPAPPPAVNPPPVAAVPPPAAPVPPPSSVGLSSFLGYGNARFGMDETQFRAAWAGELKASVASSDTCYHLSPGWTRTPAEFAFMFEDGKFVRYSTESDREAAPGGGKVGMMAAEIHALYPGRVTEQPHKYVGGGKYLRIPSSDSDAGVLIFEVEPDGRIEDWRVGREPQVDYVEGCS